MRQVTIYLLIEEFTKTILYIGKSLDITRRLGDHRRRNPEFTIGMEILEIVDESNWENAEKYWIKLFKDFDLGILNKASGGNQWPIERNGNLNKGRKSPFKGKSRPEISASLLGKPHPHKNSRKNWTQKTSSKGGTGKRRVNDVMKEFGLIDREEAKRIYYSRKASGYYND